MNAIALRTMNHLKIALLYVGFGFLTGQLFSQKSSVGVSFPTYYTFKTVHYSPAFFFQMENHAIYAGPDVISVIKPLGDPINSYEKGAVGLQFGYAYTFFQKNKLSFFGDFHFSMYNYQTNVAAMFTTTKANRLVVENSLAIAANYQVTKGLSVYAGAGINSYDGFFLLLEHSSATCFAGVKCQFQFRKETDKTAD